MEALLSQLRRRPELARKRAAIVLLSSVSVGVATWALRSTAPIDIGRMRYGSCSDGQVWNETSRTAVADAFDRSGRAHARDTKPEVLGALERFANAWVLEFHNACEPSHGVEPPKTEANRRQRMLCLERGLEALNASVEVLAAADDRAIDRATSLADALPAAADCTESRNQPLEDTPKVRAQAVEALHQRLAQIRAMLEAGQGAEVVALAKSVGLQARAMESPQLLTEALLAHGSALGSEQSYEEAANVLRAAALAAERSGNLEHMVDARTLLAEVVGDRLHKLELGHLWADLAQAPLDRLGAQPRREAKLQNARALILVQESRPEDVLIHRERAVELARSLGATGELELASYATNLAQTLGELGHYDKALVHAKEAEAIWVRRLGAAHPRLAIAKTTFGLILDAKGDYEAALAHYEAGYEHAASVFGTNSGQAADILNNVAIAAARLGHTDRAHTAFLGLLEARKAQFPQGHTLVAQAHHNLGISESMRGDHARALEHHQAALRMREELFGLEHAQLIGSMVGVANAMQGLGQVDAALEVRRRGLDIERSVYGPEHPSLTLSLANFAYNAMEAGRLNEALRTAEQGHEHALAAEIRPDLRAFARVVLARVLAELGDSGKRVRDLVATAEHELGELPADNERKLIAEIRARHPPKAKRR